MSKHAILSRVRNALGRTAAQAPPPLPDAHLRPSAPNIATFFACIERLNGKTFQAASAAQARDYVAALVKGTRAVASNSTVLQESGITALSEVSTSASGTLRTLCSECAIGITSADFALADTGTLVMLSSHQEARMISLLPPLHVAVVPRSRILGNLDELLTMLPLPAAQSSSMVMITGPSRTGDIEQILVRGVHGPGELHVVVF